MAAELLEAGSDKGLDDFLGRCLRKGRLGTASAGIELVSFDDGAGAWRKYVWQPSAFKEPIGVRVFNGLICVDLVGLEKPASESRDDEEA